ncbi:cytochrome P450 2C29-like isoform X3 [Mytilus californianus]|uniref:cytochrome P450 2C29-like isoform X3 n=1 Tax=Mytilus californianus TaxID=6549 RepID=UPI002245B250|nr:cytochrome P450 2C29-like isoform X3 [Mytilus californianus]
MDIAYSYLEGIDLTATFIFLIIFLATVLWMTCPKSDIPGPRAWPIFGNILLVSQFNSTPKRVKFVEEMTRQYGPMFRMFLGPYQIVFVQGHKHVIDVLQKRGREFIDRPNFIPGIKLAEKAKGGSGIVFANGDDWKDRRRFLIQAMRDFGVGRSSMEENIIEEIQNVADDLEKMKGAEITNLNEMMIKASCNVIHSLIFGYRYKHDNESLQKLIKTMDNIFSGPGSLSASGIFPILNLIRKDFKDLKMRSEGFSTLKKYIEKRITEHRESFDPENIRDFIDMYLVAEKEESERTSVLNPVAFLTSIIDLFAAGTYTTSTTLNWSFLWMIQYPDVQKRCQEEITKVIGSGRMVRLSDRRHLSYTEATLMEIQRLSNTAIFAHPYVAVCDTTTNGFKIPKNTIIDPSLISAHFDETIWRDPKEFNPGRFLNQNNDIINKEYLIPFLSGPRICPGESLARSELFLIFSNLLHRFEFSKVDPDDISSFEGITGIAMTPSPYRLKADLR